MSARLRRALHTACASALSPCRAPGGHAEVLGFFGYFMELSNGTCRIPIDDIFAKGDRVVVLCTESAQRGNRRWSCQQVPLWTVTKGRATVFWQFQGDQQSEDEFLVHARVSDPSDRAATRAKYAPSPPLRSGVSVECADDGFLWQGWSPCAAVRPGATTLFSAESDSSPTLCSMPPSACTASVAGRPSHDRLDRR
jgi:hypothetical protein